MVSDSGAESCTEDKLRTAQVFMTGIQSAILSSTSPDTAETGEDIVSEVSQRQRLEEAFIESNIFCFPSGGERPFQADGLTAKRFVVGAQQR